MKPDTLGAAGNRLWEEVLADRHDLKKSDGAALAILCRWYSRFEALVDQDGKHIAAGIATDKVLLLLAKFGLTPADRVKVPDGGAREAKVPARRPSAADLKPPPATEEPLSGEE